MLGDRRGGARACVGRAPGSGRTLEAKRGGSYAFSQIEQASDILTDGTQDPTQTCDGISIGLGFDALPDQLGTTAPPLPQAVPCDIDAGDAGADDGG